MLPSVWMQAKPHLKSTPKASEPSRSQGGCLIEVAPNGKSPGELPATRRRRDEHGSDTEAARGRRALAPFALAPEPVEQAF